MKARRYKVSDFNQVRSWLEARGMKVFHPDILPKYGFIVDDIAVMYLYKTDSDICYIENLVSNPETEERVRNEAINLIVEACLKCAMGFGFKFVMAVTDVPAVISRAVAKGALVETGKVLLTKQLY